MKRPFNFSIEFEDGIQCVGVPIPKTYQIDVCVDLDDEEFTQMKDLIKASTLDEGAGLMPILEQGAPVLFAQLDAKFEEAIKMEMIQRDQNESSIFTDNEPDDFEFTTTQDTIEEYEDVPYICQIPEALKKS